jgi:carboxyl-terminal processing protease
MKSLKVRGLSGLAIIVAFAITLWLALYSPSAYLRSTLDTVQESAYYSDRVDWNQVRAQALELGKGAITRRDTYPAIEYALAALGDKHSFLQPRLSTKQLNAAVQHNKAPLGLEIGTAIGYVQLPGLLLNNGVLEDGRQYATVLQQEIARLDRKHSRCGWIVDLRENFGGNFGRMLAGIGPILGEGEAMSFVFRGGNSFSWSYSKGQAIYSGQVDNKVEEPYQLKQAEPAVAVLIGPKTVSAGEAVAISFMGRPNTRFFGQPTAGLTTGNQGFALADGSTLFLTVAIGADRLNRRYSAAITPDEIVPLTTAETDFAESDAVKVAASWLGSQPSCQGPSE